MATSVRYASLDDLAALTPLFDAYRVFYREASNLAASRAFLQQRLALNESVLLLAEIDGVASGFIQLYPLFSSASMARIWLLNDLFVTESARGQGVARALMEKARQHGVATGALRLELSTAHANLAGQALYESLGYQLDQEFRYYALAL
ncbi:dTDP-fucosamine acetyltransferase [Andreprevotia sp. IGB-42]|uniref:GNAT family N-acetyltransferase n=1 Tax=Andreprevotia sp. IGB-42 TaxID=2497473 RepID=UPI00135A04B7|nr:GNAT family N-acetyltransferase [Andreprevotia sp. IGB-42]KAF0811976.1 dTDP-fucosamine acetyltransferase [Andreprevotia sp. IGB-42]